MYKLLIVDDEYEIRTGLANYFSWDQLGFEVAGLAEDGASAYRFIQSHPVDVMLCDIRMPVISGIDLARELHRNRIPVKVVLLSGYREFEYAQKALEYGVRYYLVKPTKYAEVVSVFSELKKELDDAADSRPKDWNPAAGELPRSQPEVIQRIVAYLHDNYASATLEDCAKLVYMNPFYLSKYFKQKTGENFSDYLTKVKMQKAAEILKDFKYKTYEVSTMTGYTSPKNFTRAFKKFFHCTPREYRAGGIGADE